MTTPADVLARLVHDDSAAPRITCYDDVPGPTAGERVELSGRVLHTWVSKAANALQDEWDVEPGDVVRVALRPHWRALYWAWAVWSVGGLLDLDVDGSTGAVPDPSVVVTDDPERLVAGTPGVLVTRGALARAAEVDVPPGVMDEAADLASHGDDFDAWQEPDGSDPALRVADEELTHGDVVDRVVRSAAVTPGTRVQLVDPSTEALVRSALAVWAGGGSLVVHLGGTDGDTLARRASTEGVTEG